VIGTLLRDLKEWTEGWYHTLYLKYRKPKLYKLLTDWTDDDLFEVEEPK
jgi:hypothetical protein